MEMKMRPVNQKLEAHIAWFGEQCMWEGLVH